MSRRRFIAIWIGCFLGIASFIGALIHAPEIMSVIVSIAGILLLSYIIAMVITRL